MLKVNYSGIQYFFCFPLNMVMASSLPCTVIAKCLKWFCGVTPLPFQQSVQIPDVRKDLRGFVLFSKTFQVRLVWQKLGYLVGYMTDLIAGLQKS